MRQHYASLLQMQPGFVPLIILAALLQQIIAAQEMAADY